MDQVKKFLQSIIKMFKKEEPQFKFWSNKTLSSQLVSVKPLGKPVNVIAGSDSGIHPVYKSYTRKKKGLVSTVNSTQIYGVYGKATNGNRAHRKIVIKTITNIKIHKRDQRLGYILGGK